MTDALDTHADRPSFPAIGLAFVFGAIACAVGLVLDEPRLRVTAFSLAAAFAVTIADGTGVRLSGALLGSGLLVVTPSLVGESSSRLGAALIVCSGAVALLSSRRGAGLTTGRRLLVVLPVGLVCCYWLAADQFSRTHFGIESTEAAYFAIISVALLLLLSNPIAVKSGLRVYVAAVLMSVLSMIVTLIAGSFGHSGATVRGFHGIRTDFGYSFWLPFTVTSAHTSFLPWPRLEGLAGEPGQFGLQCGLAVGLAFYLFRRRPTCIAAAAVGIAGIVLSQSLAAIVFASIAAVLALWIVGIRRASSRQKAVALLLSGALVLCVPVAEALIAAKVQGNFASLTQRGFSARGGLSFVGGGDPRTSLLASVGADGAIALLPVAALVIVVCLVSRDPGLCFSACMAGLIGLTAQPLSYPLATWLVLASFVYLRRGALAERLSSDGADRTRALQRAAEAS